MSEHAEESQETNKSLSKPEGKVYVSLGPPERAESVASLQSDQSKDELVQFKDEETLPRCRNESSPAVEALDKFKSNLKLKFLCLNEGPTNEFSQTPLSKIFTDLYITDSGSDELTTEHEFRQIEATSSAVHVLLGVYTKLFKEEVGLSQKKVYYFVHLSVQEHLAALYVHLTFMKDNRNILDQSRLPRLLSQKELTLSDLHRCAVHKALKDKNGHLDLLRLALRFQKFPKVVSRLSLVILRVLVWHSTKTTEAGVSESNNTEEITVYIKKKIQRNLPAEKFINLFHCLNELNDRSLIQEVQNYLNSGEIKRSTLSSSQWSAVVFVLLTSRTELEEFDLNSYAGANKSLEEHVFQKLVPVFKASRNVQLNCCNLTNRSCAALASAISSGSSLLRELNLSWNDLQDSGVKQLSSGLGNPHCKLEKLKLAHCGFGSEGCHALASALISNPFHLMELDLAKNDLGDSGVKQLAAVLENPQCSLKVLGLRYCGFTDEGCSALVSALKSNPSHLIELNMSGNQIDTGLKKLSALKDDPHYRLQKVTLCCCNLTNRSCVALASVISSSTSSLRELSLSWNDLLDSGVKQIATGLSNPHCKLEKLKLVHCGFGREGCRALASALISNPFHLMGLDLAKNDLGDSGVKQLCAILGHPLCTIKALRLAHCEVKDKGCAALASALKSNPSALKELGLSENKLGDSGVKQLARALESPLCTLHTLRSYS
ncbi:hypothetical protein NFI96_022823 [Prochilodus magdalenae]|nr:hypothetical protein NFI96_022823 [Prochilodus magdalenae]